ALGLARDLLASPGVAHGTAASRTLAARIRAAVAGVEGELDAEVKRGLLDARAFERRRVLGAPHVCARVGVLPAYLDEALAARLPRAARPAVNAPPPVPPAGGAADPGGAAGRRIGLAIVPPAPPAAGAGGHT